MDVSISMTRLLRSSSLFSLLAFGLIANGQVEGPEDRREIIKFGLGIKSVMTSDLLSVGETRLSNAGVDFSYSPQLSFGIDAIVRFKLKGRFSFQTGLSSIRRNYDFRIATDTLGYDGGIRQTGFQIPLNWIASSTYK